MGTEQRGKRVHNRNGRNLRRLISVALSGLVLTNAAPSMAQSLFGPGIFGPGKFSVSQSDDRFSDRPTTSISGRNNRVSKKSPGGGLDIGAEGIYLDPLVIKSRTNGEVLSVGFALTNLASDDTLYGSYNALGTLERVSFLLDNGKLISVPVENASTDVGDKISYNSVTHSASSSFTESGTISIALEDMAALASATSVAIKIEGSKRSTTYEAKDISKQFLANIAMFYEQYIKPTVRK